LLTVCTLLFITVYYYHYYSLCLTKETNILSIFCMFDSAPRFDLNDIYILVIYLLYYALYLFIYLFCHRNRSHITSLV